MRLRALCLALLALGVALDAAAAQIAEAVKVHLASELDVGRELLQDCASISLEAQPLCEGRAPFQLHADVASGCTSYYWCSPGRGACLLACAPGSVFDLSCSCCREQAAAPGFDLATCSSRPSSSSSSSDAPLLAPARRLLGLAAAAEQPSQGQAISEPAAAAAAGADDGDELITHDARAPPASGGARPPTPGTWTSYGKRYSTGPWAARNAVKEPAFARRSAGPRGSVTNEAGRAQPRVAVDATAAAVAAAAAPGGRPAVSYEDGSGMRRFLAGILPSGTRPTVVPPPAEPRGAARRLDTKRSAAARPQHAGGEAARLVAGAKALHDPADEAGAFSAAAAPVVAGGDLVEVGQLLSSDDTAALARELSGPIMPTPPAGGGSPEAQAQARALGGGMPTTSSSVVPEPHYRRTRHHSSRGKDSGDGKDSDGKDSDGEGEGEDGGRHGGRGGRKARKGRKHHKQHGDSRRSGPHGHGHDEEEPASVQVLVTRR